MLGVIKTVNDFDLVVSLPNQLTGFVSCDRISTHLTARFAAFSGNAAPTTVPSEIPSLSQFYSVGEVVVARISGLAAPGQKRRIELSLQPALVNMGLSLETIASGVMLVGEIQSQEDRGWTVAFGLASSTDIVGFLPASDVDGTRIKVLSGKTMPLLVSSAFENKTSRVVTLTAAIDTIASTKLGLSSVDWVSLRCGTKVEATIKEIKKGNLLVSVAGHNAHIDLMNLPDGVMLKRHKDLDLAEHFPVGKTILTRVAICDVEEKHVWLTSKSSILAWAPSVEFPHLGEHKDETRVTRIDPGTGLLASFSSGPATIHAYVHISRLADERVENIDGPFKVGSKHSARLIDFDIFSGMYIASFKTSDLKAPILRIQDLHPGQTVRGSVLKCESFGVVVALTDRIRALCPMAQLSELQSEIALKAYSVGQKYKFRVLDADPVTRRITLTRKKSLLDTNLPILADYSQAQVGNAHEGYIVAIRDFGCIVRFFGNVKGIVTVAEMSDEFVDRPQDSYFVGQVVRCRVIQCSPETAELKLSFRKQAGPKALPEGFKRSKAPASGPAQRSSKKSKAIADDAPKTTLDELVATN